MPIAFVLFHFSTAVPLTNLSWKGSQMERKQKMYYEVLMYFQLTPSKKTSWKYFYDDNNNRETGIPSTNPVEQSYFVRIKTVTKIFDDLSQLHLSSLSPFTEPLNQPSPQIQRDMIYRERYFSICYINSKRKRMFSLSKCMLHFIIVPTEHV